MDYTDSLKLKGEKSYVFLVVQCHLNRTTCSLKMTNTSEAAAILFTTNEGTLLSFEKLR